jgi:hypothetical protein
VRVVVRLGCIWWVQGRTGGLAWSGFVVRLMRHDVAVVTASKMSTSRCSGACGAREKSSAWGVCAG